MTFRDGEAYLFGATITPLNVASSHVVCDPTRTRKLLLNRRELDTLLGRVNRDGYTVVALSLYWKMPEQDQDRRSQRQERARQTR